MPTLDALVVANVFVTTALGVLYRFRRDVGGPQLTRPGSRLALLGVGAFVGWYLAVAIAPNSSHWLLNAPGAAILLAVELVLFTLLAMDTVRSGRSVGKHVRAPEGNPDVHNQTLDSRMDR